MLLEKDNISEFNQYMSLDKMSYIIYAEMESLIKKTDECGNNPENSSATKIGGHIPCGYSMSAIWAFDNIENNHTLYRGKNCVEKFCESLREQAKNIIEFQKKMLLLTKEELKSYQDAKICYIYGKRFLRKFANDKVIEKLENIVNL